MTSQRFMFKINSQTILLEHFYPQIGEEFGAQLKIFGRVTTYYACYFIMPRAVFLFQLDGSLHRMKDFVLIISIACYDVV